MIEKDQYQDDLSDDFNLNEISKIILYSIKNNSKKLLWISSIGFILTLFYVFFNKTIWEGKFQIVLEDKNQENNIKLQSPNSLLPGRGQFQKLKTELEILKSPSILMPVFDYVMEEKTKRNKNFKKISYREWLKQNLSIDLIRSTSVLDLSYKDSQKDLIKPVLNQISDSYQKYSNRDRNENINNGIKYLDSQINLFLEKSQNSKFEAQQFAVKYDLTNLKSIQEGDGEIINQINIEKIRIRAANKIQALENQLKVLEKTGDDPSKILYFAGDFEALNNQNLPERIEKLDQKIKFSLKVYSPNDKFISKLENEKKVLIEILKERIKGFTKARIMNAQATLESTYRPKGVLTKYKELLRVAERDQYTLIGLENQRQELSLSKAKNLTPWELITSPTIFDKPISVSNKRILFFGFISSFFFGTIVCSLIDAKKGIIYTTNSIGKILNFRLLDIINLEDKHSSLNSINTILNGELKNELCLVLFGKFPEKDKNQFLELIPQKFISSRLLNLDDITKNNSLDNILLIKGGKITKRELYNSKFKINNLGIKINGYIFIKEDKF